MDRKKLTTHALAVLSGIALAFMLGAGQPAAKVCVGVAAAYKPGPKGFDSGEVIVYRAFSDGTIQRGEH